MAIDTRDRRASAAGVLLPFNNQPPLPDGGLTGDDKQHVGYAYRGISAFVAVVARRARGAWTGYLGTGWILRTTFNGG